MRWLRPAALALSALSLVTATPSHAVVPVVFGASWDPPAGRIQSIMDSHYGAGAINATADYIGAHPGDPDPFFWIDSRFSALLVREIAGNADRNLVGWYHETGTPPVIDGVEDGVLFDGPVSAGATNVVLFDHPMTQFGFYLNPNGPEDATNAPEPEKFFTNRFYNDRGPNGVAAHAPFNGDVQALVYDISSFTQPNTWLVCFEDLDSGANPGPCCGTTDNDFNDFVFEVTAMGATPVVPMSFGALKTRYR